MYMIMWPYKDTPAGINHINKKKTQWCFMKYLTSLNAQYSTSLNAKGLNLKRAKFL